MSAGLLAVGGLLAGFGHFIEITKWCWLSGGILFIVSTTTVVTLSIIKFRRESDVEDLQDILESLEAMLDEQIEAIKELN